MHKKMRTSTTNTCEGGIPETVKRWNFWNVNWNYELNLIYIYDTLDAALQKNYALKIDKWTIRFETKTQLDKM